MSYSRPKSPTTHRRVSPRARVAVVALAGGVVASTAALTAGSATAFANPIAPLFHDGPNHSTVYTETNQAAGNTVLAYRASSGGGLTPLESVPTGGTGTGKSPGSQGGVTLGDNGRVLAVVNGGSNSVSVFSVDPSGSLRSIETVSSGGVDPISVTVNGWWCMPSMRGMQRLQAISPGSISSSEDSSTGRSTSSPSTPRPTPLSRSASPRTVATCWSPNR